MAEAILEYDLKKLQPGVDLDVHIDGQTIVANYGDYGYDVDTRRKANCSLTITYSNIQTQLREDGSVLVTGNITGGILTRTATGVTSVTQQNIKTWFNNQLVFDQNVATGSSGTYNLNIPGTFSVVVPPLTTKDHQAAIHFLNDNLTSTSAPDEFALGLLITNPNLPDYRPGYVVDNNGATQSHNRAAGKANIITANLEAKTMRTMNGATASDNPPLIVHSGGHKNMRKVGLNG